MYEVHLWYAALTISPLTALSFPRLSVLLGGSSFLIAARMPSRGLSAMYTMASFTHVARLLELAYPGLYPRALAYNKEHDGGFYHPGRIGFLHLYHDLRETKTDAFLSVLYQLTVRSLAIGTGLACVHYLPPVLPSLTPLNLDLSADGYLGYMTAAVRFYLALEAVDCGYRLALALLSATVSRPVGKFNPGCLTARPMQDPRYWLGTLPQFWSKGWNNVISRLLRDHIYEPLTRVVSSRIAGALTFLASGIYHAIPLCILGLGQDDCVSMVAFFTLHGIGVQLSHLLPRQAQRVVTPVFLCATLPFFLRPVLHAESFILNGSQ